MKPFGWLWMPSIDQFGSAFYRELPEQAQADMQDPLIDSSDWQPVFVGKFVEEWFVCGHPAWPDPVHAGDNLDSALRTLRLCRGGALNNDKGWLLCVPKGPRREIKGADLEALLAGGAE